MAYTNVKTRLSPPKASRHLRRQMVRVGPALQLIQRPIEQPFDRPIREPLILVKDQEGRSCQNVAQEIRFITLRILDDFGNVELLWGSRLDGLH